MAKNKLSDLVDHLFCQMEKLNDDTLDGDNLRQELARAGAMSTLASQIIGAGELAIKATKANDGKIAAVPMPKLLGLDASL